MVCSALIPLTQLIPSLGRHGPFDLYICAVPADAVLVTWPFTAMTAKVRPYPDTPSEWRHYPDTGVSFLATLG